MLELEGRRALVTGGASGIGAAVARQLREAGARIAVLDIATEGADGDLVLRCDVTREDEVASAVRQAADELGGLELAFINAGVAGLGDVLDMPVAEWDRVMAVNLRGAFLTLQHAARAIVATGRGGAVVATASTSAILSDPGYAHYGASKAGLAHLVRGAAQELARHGIRVNAVAPGPTRTPMQAGSDAFPGFREHVERVTPLGRIGEADDIAEAVLALLRLEWVTGQLLACDGGISLHSPTGLGAPP